jgi:trimethylamine:corrinoid methyltransferase-like protein
LQVVTRGGVAAYISGRDNFVMHSAGRLEAGLVSCYEKFIVNIELPRERRLEAGQEPPLDDAIRAKLEELVVRRRVELGD